MRGFKGTLLLATGLALVVIAVAIGALFLVEDDGSEETPVVEAPSPTATLQPAPTATAVPPPVSNAPLARISIPAIAVSAPIITLGLDAAGAMQSPSNPDDVGWYTFAARPGNGSNVVLSGHVDYLGARGPVTAVFWRLRDLKAGDEVQLALTDGASFAYRISSVEIVDADLSAEKVREIVGPTSTEQITLITCTGTFNPSVRDYNKRLVVKGSRVL